VFRSSTKDRGRALTAVIGAMTVALLVTGGIAVAAEAPGSGVINGCKNNANGQLRVVAPDVACKGGEADLDWNVQGPAGPPGADGGDAEGLAEIQQQLADLQSGQAAIQDGLSNVQAGLDLVLERTLGFRINAVTQMQGSTTVVNIQVIADLTNLEGQQVSWNLDVVLKGAPPFSPPLHSSSHLQQYGSASLIFLPCNSVLDIRATSWVDPMHNTSVRHEVIC
jgi:hypothetical protein